MSKVEQIDKWAAQFEKLIPESIKTSDFSLRERVRALLEGFAADLNLPSREEFDVQTKVLLKTRQKLEALEKEVASLKAE